MYTAAIYDWVSVWWCVSVLLWYIRGGGKGFIKYYKMTLQKSCTMHNYWVRLQYYIFYFFDIESRRSYSKINVLVNKQELFFFFFCKIGCLHLLRQKYREQQKNSDMDKSKKSTRIKFLFCKLNCKFD